MLGTGRHNKIATILQRAIANIIRDEMKDPRVNSLVSISNVEVSKDKSYARIYITMLASESEHQAAVQGLNQAVGFIRSRLLNKIQLKYIPKIKFYLDNSIVHGQKIASLLAQQNLDE